MSDRESSQGQSARLLRALIWTGVGLAPVAAVVVLIGGSDNSVRFAVVLIAVCVVLIGASMLIRSDPVLLGMDVEDRVGEEIDSLREELRAEFATAARATHHRVQALQEEIGRLRTNPFVPAPPGAAGSGRPEAGNMPARSGTGHAPAWPEPGQAPVRPEPAYQSEPPYHPEPAYPSGRAEPGHTTGGRAAAAAPMSGGGPAVGARAAVVASAPGWPEPAPTTRGRAVVASASVAPPHPGVPGQVPRQRGAAVAPPPPMAPVFRPPTSPSPRGPEYGGMGGAEYGGAGGAEYRAAEYGGTGRVRGPGSPPPAQYGASWQAADEANNNGIPTESHWNPYDTTPEAEWQPAEDDPFDRWQAQQDDSAEFGVTGQGRRRADITAIDLGYTGRRSRPDHASGPDGRGRDSGGEHPGYRQDPEPYGPDPLAEQYWRQQQDRW